MCIHIQLATYANKQAEDNDLITLRSSLHAAERIVVLVGAGISTSCGIPDFRSNDGLYATSSVTRKQSSFKGEELFSVSALESTDKAAEFYRLISRLKSTIDHTTPSTSHKFLKALDNQGKLLRCYTQNFDGLEIVVGLDDSQDLDHSSSDHGSSKVVQLHGSIHHVHCTICGFRAPMGHLALISFAGGKAPSCRKCIEQSNSRERNKKRRLPLGFIRPSIVLYSEAHPNGDEIGESISRDMLMEPDLFIVMGTSLKVSGIQTITRKLSAAVRRNSSNKHRKLVVYVNKTAPPTTLKSYIDYWIEGETDVWCAEYMVVGQ